MKFLVVLCCFLAVTLAVRDPEWESFKAKFSRKYKNPTEETFRHKIFSNNKMLIQQQNQRHAEGKSTFTMGINQFADMTTQEFSERMNGYKMKPIPANAVHVPPQVSAATVDWRTSGCVTGVKDQGQCGACWSFSTTGSTEFVNCANGKTTSLSEQNLVDCSVPEGNLGCDGGLMDSAFDYIIKNGGIDTEASYPYTAPVTGVGACQYTVANKAGSISKFTDVKSKDETALQTAADKQPVSVAIDASHASFQLYTSGVYNEPLCSQTSLDHGVLVIGYGTDGATPYWLVKNSWGVSWGIAGYIEMTKGSNQCGIATQASYPTK